MYWLPFWVTGRGPTMYSPTLVNGRPGFVVVSSDC